MAWNVLSPDEKQEILALFPTDEHILNPKTEAAEPNIASLMNDDNFRHDCARYVENIESGKHDPEWLEQAWTAHERRRAGDFDDYLAQKFEDDWDVEVPEHLKPQRKTTKATGSSTVEQKSQDGESSGAAGPSSPQRTTRADVENPSDPPLGNPEDRQAVKSLDEDAGLAMKEAAAEPMDVDDH